MVTWCGFSPISKSRTAEKKGRRWGHRRYGKSVDLKTGGSRYPLQCPGGRAATPFAEGGEGR
jgi:hypothetical protein